MATPDAKIFYNPETRLITLIVTGENGDEMEFTTWKASDSNLPIFNTEDLILPPAQDMLPVRNFLKDLIGNAEGTYVPTTIASVTDGVLYITPVDNVEFYELLKDNGDDTWSVVGISDVPQFNLTYIWGPAGDYTLAVRAILTNKVTIPLSAPVDVHIPIVFTGAGLPTPFAVLGVKALIADLPIEGEYNTGWFVQEDNNLYVWDTIDGTWKPVGMVQGADGQQGPAGADGPAGPAGVGIPTGGSQYQLLKKASADDYDMFWADNHAGGVTYTPVGSYTFATDVQGAVNTLYELVEDSTGQHMQVGRALEDAKEPTGVVNADDILVTYDKLTRTVTVAPSPSSGGSFDYWNRGYRSTVTEPLTVTHDDTTGLWFIYFAQPGLGLAPATQVPWQLNLHTPITALYWNSTLQDAVLLREVHGITMDAATHSYLHSSRGTQILSGGAISGYTLATDNNAAITPDIASVVIADEDLRTTTTALVAGTGVYKIWSRTGVAGQWTWQSSDVPFTVGTRIQYNAVNAGAWALIDVPNNSYVNVYVVAIPAIDSSYQYGFILGQTYYSSLGSAQAETINSLTLGDLPFTEMGPLHRLTFHTSNSHTTTGKVTLEGVSRIVGASVTVNQSGVGAHSGLSGLTDTNVHPASSISVVATGFTGALSVTDIDVQQALVTLDKAQAKTFVVKAVNKTGATIVKGSVVGLGGADAGLPTMSLVSADTATPPLPRIVGVVENDIVNTAAGTVVVEGLMTGMDTSALADGSEIWLDVTPGAMTVMDSMDPIRRVKLGLCITADATAGILYVLPASGSGVVDLSDYDSSVTAENGQVLTYAATGWYPAATQPEIHTEGIVAGQTIKWFAEGDLIHPSGGWYPVNFPSSGPTYTIFKNTTAPTGGNDDDIWLQYS